MSLFYNKYRSLIKLGIVIFLILIVNIFSSNFFFRIDLSKDQIHSLSEKTKQSLENLDEIITADVFLVGDYPAEIEKLKKSLYEKLNEFKAYGGENFQINYIDLDEDPEIAKAFKNQGF